MGDHPQVFRETGYVGVMWSTLLRLGAGCLAPGKYHTNTEDLCAAEAVSESWLVLSPRNTDSEESCDHEGVFCEVSEQRSFLYEQHSRRSADRGRSGRALPPRGGGCGARR